jgi:hypothetical protein
MAIAAIARLDWPEAWPALTGTLIGTLRERASADAVHGALRCLALIAGDLDELSLPRVVPVLFPELYALVAAVLDGTPGCPASLARRALSVLHACLGTLAYVSGSAASAARELVAPYTPLFLDACSRALAGPLLPRHAGACGLQMEALKVLVRLLLSFPSASAGADASRAMGAVWGLLSRAHGAYLTTVVEGRDEGNEDEGDDADCDSDGEELSLEALVAQLLELLLCLTSNRRYSAAIAAAVPGLVPLALGLMQLTAQQEEDWASNSAAFAAEEEEDCVSVRATGEMLLDDLLAELPDVAAPALAAAVAAAMAPGAGWKAREAAMLAMGSCAERLLEPGAPRQGAPDAASLVSALVQGGELSPAGMRAAPPLLVARALRCAALLARAAPADAAGPLLDAVLAALAPNAHPACRAAAARAAAAYVPFAPATALGCRAAALHAALGAALATASSDGDADAAEALLEPTLDALRALVRADATAAAAAAPQLTPALLGAWSARFNDPTLSRAAASVLSALSRNGGAAGALLGAALPQLRGVLCSPNAQPPGLLEAAAELAHALLRRHAGDEPTARAAHGLLFAPCASLAVSCDDAVVVSSAVALLRDLLRAGRGAAVSWGVDGSGGGGDAVAAALEVASRLLAPGSDDAAAAAAPALMCSLLRRAPAACAPLLPAMAAAAAGRLRVAAASSTHITLVPKLLGFFARLVQVVGAAAFADALAALRDPAVCGDDGSALDSVMRAWTVAQPDVHGAASIRATTAALTALLCCGHAALAAVSVRGEPLPDAAPAAIRTRARARAAGPTRYASQPLPAALLALVADALLEEAEGAAGGGFEDWGGDDDDDDDDAEGDEAEQAAAERALRDASLGVLNGALGDDEDDDDADGGEESEDEAADATPLAPWIGAQLRGAAADPARAAALTAAAGSLTARRQRALQLALSAQG